MKLFTIETFMKAFGEVDTVEAAREIFSQYAIKGDEFEVGLNNLQTMFPEGFYFMCSEADEFAQELHDALPEDDKFYNKFRRFEDALEMEKTGDAEFIDVFHFISQTPMSSPKLKHKFLTSCEGGITAQFFHKDDLEALMEVARQA